MTTRTILDLYVLQTVPPSNLNRDDTGAPKTAVYGGVTRARVSSQAWKRATRRTFHDLLDPNELGVRTKRVADLLAERIRQLDGSVGQDEALALAATTVQAATGSKIEPPKRRAEKAKKAGEPEPAPESSYLMFLSAHQVAGLAELALSARGNAEAYFKDKEHRNQARQIANSRHSVDIALFGRMVADGADINVDAACQVAHAISVHRVDNESDYFTAVDDRKKRETDDLGAGMIGTVEFNSATLYRYAAVDVDLLAANLGMGLPDGEPTTPVRRAVEAFVRGFITSLPTGKTTTFAPTTLPDAAVVKLRTSRPVNLVSVFEEPCRPGEHGGHLREACTRFAHYLPETEKVYGVDGDPTWLLRIGPGTEPLSQLGTGLSIDELVTAVGAAVADRVADRS